ncbi:MAG: hypothetical protein HQ525_10710 [Anaerolineae bacterium]|uniref:Uncharacterized protein n=1 Tax=Candidatus Desulfolinea nitratireducens TaxID=2841698 RepID=A0A8J6TF89_9CHLR|nr:hypothetical protein [Candidatus Desulfolinea nitratireducens]MBL6960805.1 hypothetical protein [Anaerolineales bacterium]NQU31127.1 hypothetical protein [Anaerolineae bacterium]
MKKDQEFRKMDTDVMGLPPITMVLSDIPEPIPGELNFRKVSNNARKLLFQDSDMVHRLIDHIIKKD